jgi:drug/metabolite transporter (DMT)-like permease
VLGNLQVIVVGLIAWLVLKERPPRPVLLALPIVLVGVVLISGVIGKGTWGVSPPLGVSLGIFTAICYAGYQLIIRRGSNDLRRPAGPVAISTASTAVVAIVVGALLGVTLVVAGIAVATIPVSRIRDRARAAMA